MGKVAIPMVAGNRDHQLKTTLEFESSDLSPMGSMSPAVHLTSVTLLVESKISDITGVYTTFIAACLQWGD